MAKNTHRFVKSLILIALLRIPIDLEHKRLEEALNWDNVHVQTKEEAMEKMLLQIIKTNGLEFPHLKAFLKGYYNLRREI